MPRKEYQILLAVLIFLLIVTTYINLSPATKESVQDFFMNTSRKVLAQANGDLTGHSDSFTVIKVKDHDNIAIEVYQNKSGEDRTEFRARYVLPEKRDGHFTYQGNAIRLLLMDINADGSMEILTSSFDENLVPRMHVLRFNNERLDFEELQPDSVNL